LQRLILQQHVFVLVLCTSLSASPDAPIQLKPGQCPIPEMIPLCAESCFNDGQCPGTQKCCPTTGALACSGP
uniref:WAP domain-containing protein n=1 Tax=Cyprinus carpio TaxID=7962 RepID=A0A8C1XKZ6_CYPCA